MTPLFTTLILGILLTSFMGSLHCVGMCGGLVMSVVRTRRDSIFYHLGRLVSYLTLGALAGLIGKELFSSPLLHSLQFALSILVFLFFLWMAVQIWKQKTPHLSIIPAPLLLKIQKWSLNQNQRNGTLSPAFLIGLSSGLLPCGWLHTYVIAATAAGSAFNGALVLLFFWLGTVPALSTTGWITQNLSSVMTRYSARAFSVVLVFFGAATLILKSYPQIKSFTQAASSAPIPAGEMDSCPMHSEKQASPR